MASASSQGERRVQSLLAGETGKFPQYSTLLGVNVGEGHAKITGTMATGSECDLSLAYRSFEVF
jgi:hypothetical protein